MVPLLAVARPADAGACGEAAALDWLLGHWQAESGDKQVLEHWWVTPEGMLAGEGETLSATGERLMLEQLRLERADGTLRYRVDVSTNSETVNFALSDCDASRWVFENAAHDFPQRIIYRRTGQDTFTATVTDLGDQGFELHFERLPAKAAHD